MEKRYHLAVHLTWWRHEMETFSALLATCVGNSPVPGEFPAQRPVTRSFYVFFNLRLNKSLSKQWRGWWFETLSRPLWRHRNDHVYPDGVSILDKVMCIFDGIYCRWHPVLYISYNMHAFRWCFVLFWFYCKPQVNYHHLLIRMFPDCFTGSGKSCDCSCGFEVRVKPGGYE